VLEKDDTLGTELLEGGRKLWPWQLRRTGLSAGDPALHMPELQNLGAALPGNLRLDDDDVSVPKNHAQ